MGGFGCALLFQISKSAWRLHWIFRTVSFLIGCVSAIETSGNVRLGVFIATVSTTITGVSVLVATLASTEGC